MNPHSSQTEPIRHADGPTIGPGRHRVLIQAYACLPDHGSEEGVGWNRAIETAKYFDTWVICCKRLCANGIRRHFATHGAIPGLRFVYLSNSRRERFLAGIPGLRYLAYNLWNRRAGRLAQRLHKRHRFSLVHHLNYCGFREPGYLWKLDAPFVWGPLGGAQNYPWRFLPKAGLSVTIREGVRSIINELQLRFSPRVRKAAQRAALLMAATTTNYQALTRAHRVKPLIFIEGGVAERSFAATPPRTDGILRILWCGNLEPWKALHLLIEALAQLPQDVRWELRVVGSGSLATQWQRMAEHHGLDDRIRWMGQVSHQEALEQFTWADILAFTSLRDTSGTVMFESLAAGKPILCLDHQGAADIVDSSCGIKVPVTYPQEVIAGLAQAIALLARNPAMRDMLGRGARRRVQKYLWSDQGKRLAELYRQVIASNVQNDSAVSPLPYTEVRRDQCYSSSRGEISPVAMGKA